MSNVNSALETLYGMSLRPDPAVKGKGRVDSRSLTLLVFSLTCRCARVKQLTVNWAYRLTVENWVNCKILWPDFRSNVLYPKMFLGRKDMTRYLKQNAVFVINCSWDKSEIEKQLPAKMRKDLAEKKARHSAGGAAHNLGSKIWQTLFFPGSCGVGCTKTVCFIYSILAGPKNTGHVFLVSTADSEQNTPLFAQ